MAFFRKLKDRLFKSSSKLEEGLDAIVGDGGVAEEVEVEILCHANNWSWEFAFLGRARWVVEGSE